jgi:NAD(P)-dependent dehydrogenase (short-subunit alcohol dehydrogenase family)
VHAHDASRLRGKTALVIGATGGIGYHTALGLADEGAALSLHGRSEERLAAVRDVVERHGAECRTIAQDLAVAEDVVPVIDAAPPVDVLVIAYGPFLEKPVLETSPEEWRHLHDMNVVLPALVFSRLLPSMIERGFGRVVVFGGTGTHRVSGYRTIAAYSAEKTALGVLVKSAAREAAGSDVAVNAVCPGPVDTEYLSEAQRRRFRRVLPGGEMPAPGQIVPYVLSLIVQDSPFMNGALVPLDGGMM